MKCWVIPAGLSCTLALVLIWELGQGNSDADAFTPVLQQQGAVTVHQDVSVYAGLFEGAEEQRYALPAGRRAWVHLARGTLRVGETLLGAGDGAGLTGPAAVHLNGGRAAEVLLFDLPG